MLLSWLLRDANFNSLFHSYLLFLQLLFLLFYRFIITFFFLGLNLITLFYTDFFDKDHVLNFNVVFIVINFYDD